MYNQNNIVKTMHIVKNVHLSNGDIRRMCIRENLYTRGDNSAYMHMLMDIVGVEGIYSPTDEQIYDIAKDIATHSVVPNYGYGSEDFVHFVCNIMHLISKEIRTSYEWIG